MAELVTARPGALPVGPTEEEGVGWNGMVTLIATEAALFLYLLFSYFYTGASATAPWVLEARPKLGLAGPNTLILLLSSAFVWWGERGIRQGRRGQAMAGSGIALLLGILFAAIQVLEWKAKTYGIGTSSYASLYFVTTGFHMAHVLVGLAVLLLMFVWTWLGYFSVERRIAFTNGAYYWHFVDAVWLFVFATYYVSPYLGFGL
jgi:heme/copper-type cytochrome/quinol oxidase subunit 3